MTIFLTLDVKNYTPRGTQGQLIRDVVERLKTNDNVALIASTGGGKTITAAHLIAYYTQVFNPTKDGTLNPRAWTHGTDFNHIIFIVHLDNLVQQTYEKFKGVLQSRVEHLGKKRERNLSEGITFIKSGMPFDASKPIVIASLQTLAKRYEHYIDIGCLNPVMLVFDECHTTAFCETGRKLIDELKPKRRLGLTATPFRLEKEVSFSDIWDNCVVSPSFGEMIKLGELTPITYKAFVSADELKQVKKVKGNFNEKDAAIKFNTPQRIQFAIDKWESVAKDRKTIVFSIDVKHGEAIKEQFIQRGYTAEIISYKVESKNRDPIYKSFAEGKTQILISVKALAVGFDEPSCSCGIDLQPTTSISGHWQKIGRIARLHPGKKDALWLDFVGNIENLGYFGCPDDVRMSEESILSKKDFTKREGEAPSRFCPECNTVNHASAKVCKECNYEFPIKVITDIAPTGDLVTIVTKAMVKDSESAIAFYRTLRHKKFIKKIHPNAAYHEYESYLEIKSRYPIPHPREREDHKYWSMGCIVGKNPTFDNSFKFLDEITKMVRKSYKDKKIAHALIDSAIWLEFDNDIYDILKNEIDNYDKRQKEFLETLIA